MNPYIAWPRSAKVASVLFMILATGMLLIEAKPVLVPIALAVLFAFLLHPLVKRLHRAGMNRVVSVLLVVTFATVVVGGVGYVVSAQLKSFADELPSHERIIEAKVLSVKSLLKGGTIDRLKQMFRDINARTDLRLQTPAAPVDDSVNHAGASNGPTAATTSDSNAGEQVAAEAATPTMVIDRSDSAGGLPTASLAGSAIEFIATAGLVILLVTFFLIQQADLRDRLVSVAGRGALATTTKALEEAGQRISKYLLMLFIVNATFGLCVALGLVVIGVPYAAMWGLAAAALRYIPFAGPWIAAAMPMGVSVVTASGWSQPLLVFGLFIVLELLCSNLMEPIVYGHSVGISELGIILAAILWGWLWGPIGLVLATPMTVCLVVLGRYVPGLRIFDQMLGERATVSDAVRVYQRLLAKDVEDVEDLIQNYLKEHSLIEASDNVLLPAIELIRHDLVNDQTDSLDAERMDAALESIIADLSVSALKDAPQTKSPVGRPLVMGVAAHTREEVLLLDLLEATLADCDCQVEVLSNEILLSERLAAIEEQEPVLVVVSSLPPGDLGFARQLCKRIKSLPDAPRVVVARWGQESGASRTPQLVASGADEVVMSMADLHRLIDAAAQFHRTSHVAPEQAEQLAAV